jgi:hypothetical protein
MVKKKVPRHLWDYGLVYEAEIMSRISRGPKGRTDIEMITGDTPDIDFGTSWLSAYSLNQVHVTPHK